MFILLFITLISANDYNNDNYRKAVVYSTRELWKTSDVGKTTSKRIKVYYKENITKEHRQFLDNLIFPLTQILINKEIRYEWDF